jgi:hypothetical protein
MWIEIEATDPDSSTLGRTHAASGDGFSCHPHLSLTWIGRRGTIQPKLSNFKTESEPDRRTIGYESRGGLVAAVALVGDHDFAAAFGQRADHVRIRRGAGNQHVDGLDRAQVRELDPAELAPVR